MLKSRERRRRRAIRSIHVLTAPIVLLLVLLALLPCGCAHSSKSRQTSFSEFAGDPPREAELRSFLSSRVVLLVSADEFPEDDFSFVMGGQEGKSGTTGRTTQADGGCAIAIDSRGYFITAAHVLRKERAHLIFRTETSGSQPGNAVLWVARRVRIVWRGDRAKLDLAIIHLPGPLTNVFEWAESAHHGDPVGSVGLSQPTSNSIEAELLGGRLLGSHIMRGEPAWLRVVHSTRTRPGYSGGPLADRNGRLLGINVAHRRLSRWWPRALAVRPDLEWLRDLIEKDAAEQAGRSALTNN